MSTLNWQWQIGMGISILDVRLVNLTLDKKLDAIIIIFWPSHSLNTVKLEIYFDSIFIILSHQFFRYKTHFLTKN